MDTEKDFEELTGTGVGADDAGALTEVVDDELIDEELPAEVDPLVAEDTGAFGGEEESEDEEEAAYFYQNFDERN